ncbi:MAG: FAD-binding oxidoreductase, partial [Rhodospirillales bacterium]|nr:FAD-binding oxidoreductase [Rhodospirillales bacterium]
MTAVRVTKLDGSASELDAGAIEGFRNRFRGPLLQRETNGYDDARRVWNSLIDRKPALIALCTGTADVIEAVNFANDHDLLVAVRGGGHNVSGSAVCDGGLIVDLSLMRGVRVDRATATARAQGGATWAEVDRESQVFGLATTGGNISKTGIGGLTLGGGFGHMRRKHGLSIDNLVSVDIVTAGGECITANAHQHSDLFWALRGGGGNFGVVTSFQFRVHEIGPEVMFALPFYALEDAPAVLSQWRDFVEQAPNEISSIALFWRFPPIPLFPAEAHGRRVLGLAAMFAGPADKGETALQPLRQMGKPLFDMSGRGPYVNWQSAFDPFFMRGPLWSEYYGYWKSLYLNGLPEAAIEGIVAAAREVPSESNLIALWHMGGAAAQVPVDATAFAKRHAPYLLSFDTSWTDPALSDQLSGWTRRQVDAMQKYSPGGAYLNFPGVGEDNEELVRTSYGENYARLVEVKTKYDPGNLFRMNVNIRPRKPEAMRQRQA